MTPKNILLSGVVGSTAYGLAHEGSDVDRLGMFAAPTAAFHGLTPPKETIDSHQPDVVYQEAGKWIRLALNGNPAVLELAWLNDYEVTTPLGEDLIAIRQSLLSAQRVRDAYLGYATQQFHRLKSRKDGTFSSDTRLRTEKHARHMWRLLMQGTELHLSGSLTVRLTSSEVAACRSFGKLVTAGDTELADRALRDAEGVFNGPGVLPEQPDRDAAEAWLLRVREYYWDRLHVPAVCV